MSTADFRSAKNSDSSKFLKDLYLIFIGFNFVIWDLNIVVIILWWSLIPVVTDLVILHLGLFVKIKSNEVGTSA